MFWQKLPGEAQPWFNGIVLIQEEMDKMNPSVEGQGGYNFVTPVQVGLKDACASFIININLFKIDLAGVQGMTWVKGPVGQGI